MKLEGIPQVLDFDPFSTRTEAEATHNLGEAVYLADGRIFRYAKAGSSDISQGKLQVGPAPKTNHHNIAAASAASVNTNQVTVTLGATAATANEYAEGYLVANDNAPEGSVYKIKSHPAANANASLTLTLFDPLDEAVTTSSEFCLVHNTYNGVVEGTSATRNPAGVPLEGISAGDYGWLQTRGVAAVLADGTITLGSYVMASGSVAGAVAEHTDVTAPITQAWVGRAIVAGVDTEYRPIFLTID